MFELSIVVFTIILMAPVVIKMVTIIYNLKKYFTSGIWWSVTCHFIATGFIGLIFFDWVTSKFVSWSQIVACPLGEKALPLGIVFLAIVALFLAAWEIESRAIGRRGRLINER